MNHVLFILTHLSFLPPAILDSRASNFSNPLHLTTSHTKTSSTRLSLFASILNATEKTKTRNSGSFLSSPESTASADTTRLLVYCHRIGDTRAPLLRQWSRRKGFGGSMDGCSGWMVVDKGAKVDKAHSERLRPDLRRKETNRSQWRALLASGTKVSQGKHDRGDKIA